MIAIENILDRTPVYKTKATHICLMSTPVMLIILLDIIPTVN